MPTLSYDDIISRLTLQAANIDKYKTDVGATVAEIADITNDLANLEYARDYADVIDGNKKTVFQIKQAVFNGDANIDVPDYPASSAGVLPQPAKAGAYQRYNERGQRWKTAPGWTDEIGTALAYGGPAGKPEPSAVKPTIELFAAAHDAHFSIVVAGRGEATMWDVYIMRKGGSWTKHETCSGKSADIHVTPTTPGNAEQIQVYIQLRKNNENYGQPSDPAYVTLNP